MLLLLTCWIIAGIIAGDPVKLHYGVKNSSLCLRVENSQTHRDPRWTYNTENVIAIYGNITPSYTKKVDYNPKDFSLCINNLTETDSGVYELQMMNANYKMSKETHRLIVEEAVPRPVIRMSVVHHNLSAVFCNITVNCSIQEEWAWSVCDLKNCRTSQTSLRRLNITISAANRTVVCRGKNNVSKNTVYESINSTCFSEFKSEDETSQPTILLIILLILAAACVLLCTFIVCAAKRCFSTKSVHHQARTSVQSIQSRPLEGQSQPASRESTSSTQSGASYENVDVTQSPTVSPRQELESEQSLKTYSVYSVLQVPYVTATNDTQDNVIQEASQPAEAEPPVQIDTVYSLLQCKNMKPQPHH